MYLGFDFYRNGNTIVDLDERINRINAFLASHVGNESHRHFGVFLLPPKEKDTQTHLDEDSSVSDDSELFQRQEKCQHRLCIEFFDDNRKFIPDLEIIYDLGKTSKLFNAMQADVYAVSYLSSCTTQETRFITSPNSISILFKLDDSDPNTKRIKTHLEFIIPNCINRNN